MEATATLADCLLDDLDDLSDGDENQEEDNVKESATFETDQDFIPMQEEDGPTASSSATTGTSSQTLFRKRKRWLDNVQLQQHLTIISNNAQVSGEEGYTLMTTSNTYLRQVQTELTHVHLELQSAYQVKFPELAELLPQFTLYKNAIVVLQNKDLSDVTLYQEELHSVANLSSNQIITLSVAGSTTSGTTLTESQLAQVNACLSYTDQLLNVQTQLTSFVEQHISSLAPNTCILLGPTLTARLVGLAGGLSALVQIPACNLQVLGQVKATSASRAGMGTGGVTTSTVDGGNSAQPHQGILVECDLVQRVRGKDQRKALKKLANKASLVVRCDLDSNLRRGTGNGGGNEIGKKFRRELEETFRKWQEPDKAPVVKALPKPDLTTKKRRGGKRMRRLKEKFEETELMKQANRRAFSTETGEYGDDAMGLTLGMLEKSTGGSSKSGNVRQLSLEANKRKMRQANTKASRKRAAQMAQQAAGNANANGLASSMAFTPVQGLELVNPDAVKDRVKEANKKWFGEYAGFQSALPKGDKK